MVLDRAWGIVGEYKNKLNPRKQGVGDAFLKWVLTNYANPQRVEQVALKSRDDARKYDEFPGHRDLENFDPSDRIFVAVACAHPDGPPILQAADSKWIGWREALETEGVRVDFLCADDIRVTFAKKFPDRRPLTRKNAGRPAK